MTKITWDKDGKRIVNNLTYEDALVRIRELEAEIETWIEEERKWRDENAHLKSKVERLLQEREREKKHESRVRGLFERDTRLAKLERDTAARLLREIMEEAVDDYYRDTDPDGLIHRAEEFLAEREEAG